MFSSKGTNTLLMERKSLCLPERTTKARRHNNTDNEIMGELSKGMNNYFAFDPRFRETVREKWIKFYCFGTMRRNITKQLSVFHRRTGLEVLDCSKFRGTTTRFHDRAIKKLIDNFLSPKSRSDVCQHLRTSLKPRLKGLRIHAMSFHRCEHESRKEIIIGCVIGISENISLCVPGFAFTPFHDDNRQDCSQVNISSSRRRNTGDIQ